MIYIKGGLMIDPETQKEITGDMIINQGTILNIGCDLSKEAMEYKKSFQVKEIDAMGKIVAPGLVDVHVHFRDPGFIYKEDIITGAASAAKGGFTTVVMMANTNPAIDNIETLKYVIEKGKTTGIHVKSCATVTKGLKGQELVDMNMLLRAGAVGFTDDGIPIMNGKLLHEAMVMAKELSAPISLHEENPEYITENGINSHIASTKLQLTGSPREAEFDLIERDLSMALKTGAMVNIQHISTKEGVELVRRAKCSYKNVHAEATPHHFSLTEEAVEQYGTLAKMNPPLREEKDRQAILEGLKEGVIDIIATDHAPHSKEEKSRKLTDAPSGIIGLETALSLGITNLVKTGVLTMCELLQKMSTNPAKLYGFDAGSLSIGAPADIVIFDALKETKYDIFVSKSENTPFKGQKMFGEVLFTICGGRIVYQR